MQIRYIIIERIFITRWIEITSAAAANDLVYNNYPLFDF